MNYSETAAFASVLKQFKKKWRSLPDDIEDAKAVIEQLYVEQGGVSLAEYRSLFFSGKNATVLYQDEVNEVVKMRLDCASLGGSGKLRLVFVYIKTKNGIVLVELFNKADKAREDESLWRGQLIGCP
jgi:hypothetical protein